MLSVLTVSVRMFKSGTHFQSDYANVHKSLTIALAALTIYLNYIVQIRCYLK